MPPSTWELSGDERAIRDLVALWHRATAAGDVETVLGLMAEDVIFLVPGKSAMRGRASFEQGLRELLEGHRIESSGDVQEVEVSGSLAYRLTSLMVRIVPLAGGSATVRAGRALSIFRKLSTGSWVITCDANLLPSAS